MVSLRGTFRASHAVFSPFTRAPQDVESAFGTTLSRSGVIVQLLESHGDDSSRSDTERRACLQSLRLLRRVAAGQRDALRRVRSKAQQARTTVLIAAHVERTP
jgi:hypothetical protein